MWAPPGEDGLVPDYPPVEIELSGGKISFGPVPDMGAEDVSGCVWPPGIPRSFGPGEMTIEVQLCPITLALLDSLPEAE